MQLSFVEQPLYLICAACQAETDIDVCTAVIPLIPQLPWYLDNASPQFRRISDYAFIHDRNSVHLYLECCKILCRNWLICLHRDCYYVNFNFVDNSLLTITSASSILSKCLRQANFFLLMYSILYSII